jgi:hypothetical protein
MRHYQHIWKDFPRLINYSTLFINRYYEVFKEASMPLLFFFAFESMLT